MLSSSQQEIARLFFDEQDRLRGGPAAELCTPDYTAHLASNPPFDFAGHQAFALAFYTGFPDMRHTVEMAIAEDDRAAVRFNLRGCHTGDFLGIPATGRSVQISASVVMRFEAGRVAELWGEFDQAGLMRQLTNPAQVETHETPGI